MNLPPIVLPLFRIGDTRPDVERKRKTVRRGKEKAKKS
jgi:hypothetical protein